MKLTLARCIHRAAVQCTHSYRPGHGTCRLLAHILCLHSLQPIFGRPCLHSAMTIPAGLYMRGVVFKHAGGLWQQDTHARLTDVVTHLKIGNFFRCCTRVNPYHVQPTYMHMMHDFSRFFLPHSLLLLLLFLRPRHVFLPWDVPTI